jgi:hypothetical protein
MPLTVTKYIFKISTVNAKNLYPDIIGKQYIQILFHILRLWWWRVELIYFNIQQTIHLTLLERKKIAY